MKSRTPDEIKRTAWHEAGHVTIMLSLGEEFISVWVRRDLDESLHPDVGERTRIAFENGVNLWGCVNTTSTPIKLQKCLRVMMGGIAGVWILSGCATAPVLTERNMKTDDVKQVKTLIKKFKLPRTTLRETLWNAWHLLRHHSRAHRAIAEALIERGSLTYAETKEIFQGKN